MILDLAYYGDSVLRKRALPVAEVTDEIRKLVHDMMETMEHHRGAGLAAPQVKCLLRIFVTRLNDNDLAYEEWVKGPISVFINPELVEPSSKMIEDREGCLSIPGIHAKVARPASVRIRARDLDGAMIDRVYHGYHARQLMHENDHLNGVLYLDRVPKAQKKSIENYLQQMLKRQRK